MARAAGLEVVTMAEELERTVCSRAEVHELEIPVVYGEQAPNLAEDRDSDRVDELQLHTVDDHVALARVHEREELGAERAGTLEVDDALQAVVRVFHLAEVPGGCSYRSHSFERYRIRNRRAHRVAGPVAVG